MSVTNRTLLAPLALYIGALLVRLWAVLPVRFPINEGSAYYVAVAGNLVEGRGLVSDALWSYATPPLIVPRPAFELWQPMASFVSALPMLLFGPSFFSAQLGAALLGALIAPLCWAIARDAGRALELDERRLRAVSLGSGAVAALLGPFLVATAVPDSTTPFLVFGVISCWLMPRALAGRPMVGVALGIALGLTYLSRLEAVYIALTFLLLAGLRWRLLVPVVAGGLLIAVPWLGRNLLAFGTLFPGQALENVYFTRNEDVFAYLDRPSFAEFLAQGPAIIVDNIARGYGHNLLNVLLIPGAPVTLIGLLATMYLWRRPALRRGALAATLLSGLITFLVVSTILPVATLWGTFEHAAGPLRAGLLVAAALGADALVARVRELRGWRRSNAWLAPAALVALALPLSLVQVTALPSLASAQQARYVSLASALAARPDLPPRLISDHPVWLAEATGMPALALPDEPLEAIVRLAVQFEAPLIVVIEERGRYPAAFRTPEGAACFEERELGGDPSTGRALFVMRDECGR